jgi:hypothetical protein
MFAALMNAAHLSISLWMNFWRYSTAHAKERNHAVQQTYLYSMTSSANASSFGGTLTPSAFAVLRLITKSNLVGCWTGRSPGLLPLRMRST